MNKNIFNYFLNISNNNNASPSNNKYIIYIFNINNNTTMQSRENHPKFQAKMVLKFIIIAICFPASFISLILIKSNEIYQMKKLDLSLKKIETKCKNLRYYSKGYLLLYN